MAKNRIYNRLIHSSEWVRLRRRVLTERPLCERCKAEGYVTPAGEVHHIRPVESGVGTVEMERLMFDANNLMALCHMCHVRIHTEMGRSGKELSRQRNAGQTAGFVKKYFGE